MALMVGCRHRAAAEKAEYKPPARTMGKDRFCAVTIRLSDPAKMADYRARIAQASASGAQAVLFIVEGHEYALDADSIYLDYRLAPTTAQIGELTDAAHALHLRVGLMPLIVVDAPGAKTQALAPYSWDNWFVSLTDFLRHEAWTAESHHVDLLILGDSYDSTYAHGKQWEQVITDVRKAFSGQLSYFGDQRFPAWASLDLIGVELDSPVKLDTPAAAQLAQWKALVEKLEGDPALQSRPLLLEAKSPERSRTDEEPVGAYTSLLKAVQDDSRVAGVVLPPLTKDAPIPSETSVPQLSPNTRPTASTRP